MNPRIMVVPSKFDHTPLRDALDVLQKHGQDRLVALEAKARDHNWSETRKEAEIRCVADEVYYTQLDAEDD